jgi:hypothetical protein
MQRLDNNSDLVLERLHAHRPSPNPDFLRECEIGPRATTSWADGKNECDVAPLRPDMCVL